MYLHVEVQEWSLLYMQIHISSLFSAQACLLDLCFDSDILLFNSCGSWCFCSWQGEPSCIFYSRYGICKFGPSCKFDHPMGTFTYNLTASSSADAPVRRLLGSSSGSAGLTLSSEGLVEAAATKPRRLSLSEPRQMPPGDDNIDTGGWIYRPEFMPSFCKFISHCRRCTEFMPSC